MKQRTNVVFVLDRSGSMGHLQNDVIGGFNSFLIEQNKLKDEATLTTVLFNTTYNLLHDAVNIKNVAPITSKEYSPSGGTALLDALGKAIMATKANSLKKDKVIFIINTDGEENSSVEYKKEDIKKLVKEMEQTRDWKFVYIGANVDSFSEASSMGITTSTNYTSNAFGVASVYTATTNMVSSYRRGTGALDTTHLNDIK